jgi:hypothetical protein
LGRLLFILLCILSSALEFSPLDSSAKGSARPGENEMSRPVLFTAWYRDKVIHVAIANVGDKAQSLKVASGCRDVREYIFAGQPLLLPPKSIKLVYFPLLSREGAKGEPRISDHVFLLDGDSASLIAFTPVQQMSGSSTPSLDDFLAAPGDSVHLRYRIKAGNSLRLFFLPREVKVQDKSLTAVEPEEGLLKPLSRGALQKTALPADYRQRIVQMVEENFCFLVNRGEKTEITMNYTVPEIKDCAVVRLSETQYEFHPGGGVRYGMGAGLVFMIYNPKTMRLLPLSELSAANKGTGYFNVNKQPVRSQ